MNDKEETETNAERVKRFADGAERIFVNAEALYKEAELLGTAGHFARATVLHQISMEECSKIDTLGAAATSLLVGMEVDEDRLSRAFRNHKAKNHANAYLAAIPEEEKAAMVRGDWETAHKAFKEFQKKFHEDVNATKNAGLYVDFENGQFTAPTDVINEQTAIVFQRLNGFFLNHCNNFLKVLGRMVNEPDFYADFGKEIIARSKALCKSGDLDPAKIETKLITELLDKYKNEETPR